jgi:hypothetical protein
MDEYRSRMIGRNLILPFFTLPEVQAAAQAELEAGGQFRGPTAEGGLGGFSPSEHADPLGLEGLLRIGNWALFDPDGPLWFRGFATWSAAEGPSQITKLLRRYGVAHFVVGHTVPSTMRVTPRFAVAVVLIDTGMLSSVYRGGIASALEIRDGRFTAISADQRTILFEAGRAAVPSR